MVLAPSVVQKETYAFGYSNSSSDLYKTFAYIPFVGTIIAIERTKKAFTVKDINLISRIAHLARAVLEFIPFVNIVLIPIDFLATATINASSYLYSQLPSGSLQVIF